VNLAKYFSSYIEAKKVLTSPRTPPTVASLLLLCFDLAAYKAASIAASFLFCIGLGDDYYLCFSEPKSYYYVVPVR